MGAAFLCTFLGALYIFLEQAWAEGKGELATCRLQTARGRGRTADTLYIGTIYIGRMRVMTE